MGKCKIQQTSTRLQSLLKNNAPLCTALQKGSLFFNFGLQARRGSGIRSQDIIRGPKLVIRASEVGKGGPTAVGLRRALDAVREVDEEVYASFSLDIVN